MLFPKLTRPQKEAVGLLQFGTVLEYFDLSLYIHMTLILNDLFFPKSDPHTTSLLAAFAFCSTWLLRPFGALIFGWIGDNWGRKTTVVITTITMSGCCLAMASLPTYAQVGIIAAWGVTICRMVQGLSSLGEILGAEVYLTEITRPPARYTVVASVAGSAALGNVIALAVATLCTSHGFEWRYAFLIGAVIAIVGSFARTRLRETPEFTEAMERKKRKQILTSDLKTNWKTYLAYFAIDSTRPFYFYFAFVYTSLILKSDFNMDANAIIQQNWIAAIVSFLQVICLISLTIWFHPMRILGWCRYSGLVMTLAIPSMLYMANCPTDILIIQIICLIFKPDYTPGEGFLCAQMPVLKRLTSMSLLNAGSRILMYPTVTFGLVIITQKLGHYGLWIIALPLCAGYAWGVGHFRKLAKLDSPQKLTTDPKGWLTVP